MTALNMAATQTDQCHEVKLWPLLSELQAMWNENKAPDVWGPIFLELLSFADNILCADPTPYFTSDAGSKGLQLLESLHEKLMDIQLQRTVCPSAVRSGDGILYADQGVFPLLEECLIVSLDDALEKVEFAKLNTEIYWMCHDCGRPTSDPFIEHMTLRHPNQPIKEPPPCLQMDDVLRCLNSVSTPYPACTIYSMETPLYKAMNRAMREWDCYPEAFGPWRDFAALLDFELQQIDLYTGSAYRAIDFKVPPTLYQKGAVVTWNQPSSASMSPKVAKLFLKGGLSAVPSGTLFIIQCATARPVSTYSLHPEEQELLFRAGTQFQVLSRANTGLKNLLEETMWCSLQDVDVYELRELTLDSWRDLPDFLERVDQLRNKELVDLIKTMPTHWGTCRRETKLLCAPMTSLICREKDQMSALHLAVSVPHNISCVQLVSAQLKKDHFKWKDAKGRTALRLAADLGHWDSMAYLLHRGASFADLTSKDLQHGIHWITKHASEGLLQKVCAFLATDKGEVSLATLQAGLSVACLHRSRSVAQYFLDAGADVAAISPDQTYEPALVACATGGNLETLELLMGKGAVIDRDGGWALYAASCKGHIGVIKTLLESKASVASASAGDGRTPLMAAALIGQCEVVKVLLEAGDDVHACDDHGKTAVMLAAQNDHVTTIRTLVEAKANIQAMDNDGRTALMYAAQAGHISAIKALLDAQADLEAIAERVDGRTALMYAAHNGHVPALQALLQAGANVTAITVEGFTALMFAARRGHIAAIQTLIQAKADVHAVNVRGHSAAVYAQRHGRWAAYKVLQNAEFNEALYSLPRDRTDCSSAAGFLRSASAISAVSAVSAVTAATMGTTVSEVVLRDNALERMPSDDEESLSSEEPYSPTELSESLVVSERSQGKERRPPEILIDTASIVNMSAWRTSIDGIGSAVIERRSSNADRHSGEESPSSAPASVAHSAHSHVSEWEGARLPYDFTERMQRLCSPRNVGSAHASPKNSASPCASPRSAKSLASPKHSASPHGSPKSIKSRGSPKNNSLPCSSPRKATPPPKTPQRTFDLNALESLDPCAVACLTPPRSNYPDECYNLRRVTDISQKVKTTTGSSDTQQRWCLSHKVLSSHLSKDAYLGMSETGLLVTIRRLAATADMKPRLAADLRNLCALRHPNLIQCLGYSAEDWYMVVVMEYAGMSLAKVLSHFEKLQLCVSCRYARDITAGLQYLHSNGISHGDIRPENVLMSQTGDCKLVWCPTPELSPGSPMSLSKTIGSPHYRPPEAAHGELATAGDIWMLGVTVWYMLLGRPLVETTNQLATLFHSGMFKDLKNTPLDLPEDAREFLLGCLSLEPSNRCTTTQLLALAFLNKRPFVPL